MGKVEPFQRVGVRGIRGEWIQMLLEKPSTTTSIIRVEWLGHHLFCGKGVIPIMETHPPPLI